MSHTIRLACGAAMLVSALSIAAASAQTAERKPGTDQPVTFGDGVRARERLTSTPQYAALVRGLYGRQIVQSSSDRNDYSVQVWSLIVSPRGSTDETKLAGAAVLMLYAGRVELITGGQRTRLEPGATAAIPEGASLRFVNGDDSRPAQLRAIVLTGSR